MLGHQRNEQPWQLACDWCQESHDTKPNECETRLELNFILIQITVKLELESSCKGKINSAKLKESIPEQKCTLQQQDKQQKLGNNEIYIGEVTINTWLFVHRMNLIEI